MRFLLISDTHGNLGIINELAARVQANAVIHAGDFGFYDDGSYDRLSERETAAGWNPGLNRPTIQLT